MIDQTSKCKQALSSIKRQSHCIDPKILLEVCPTRILGCLPSAISSHDYLFSEIKQITSTCIIPVLWPTATALPKQIQLYTTQNLRQKRKPL